MAIKIDSTTVIDDSRNLTNINSLDTATWEAGVSTTETVISPAKVKAAIDAVAPTQVTATWEAGTDTTESLVSAAKVKAAIDALAAVGDGDITEAKLASSAVSRVKLKTATNSGSYSTGSGGGSGTINMDAYSFFPAHNGTGTVTFGGTSADAPAIKWSASTTTSGTVYWRYIQA